MYNIFFFQNMHHEKHNTNSAVICKKKLLFFNFHCHKENWQSGFQHRTLIKFWKGELTEDFPLPIPPRTWCIWTAYQLKAYATTFRLDLESLCRPGFFVHAGINNLNSIKYLILLKTLGIYYHLVWYSAIEKFFFSFLVVYKACIFFLRNIFAG